MGAAYFAELVGQYTKVVRRRAGWDVSVLQAAITIGQQTPAAAPPATMPAYDSKKGWLLEHVDIDAAMQTWAYDCAADPSVEVGTFHVALQCLERANVDQIVAANAAQAAWQIYEQNPKLRAPFIAEGSVLGADMWDKAPNATPIMRQFPPRATGSIFDAFIHYRFGFQLASKLCPRFGTTRLDSVTGLATAVGQFQAKLAAAVATVCAASSAVLEDYAPTHDVFRDAAMHAGDATRFGGDVLRFCDASASSGRAFWAGLEKTPSNELAALKDLLFRSATLVYNLPEDFNAWFDRQVRVLTAQVLKVPRDFEQMFRDMKTIDTLWDAEPVNIGKLTLRIVPPEGKLPGRIVVEDNKRILGFFNVATKERTGTWKIWRFAARHWTRFDAHIWPGRGGRSRQRRIQRKLEPIYQTEDQIGAAERAEAIEASKLQAADLPDGLRLFPSVAGIGAIFVVAVQLSALPSLFQNKNGAWVALGLARDLSYAIQGFGDALSAVLGSAAEQLALGKLVAAADTARMAEATAMVRASGKTPEAAAAAEAQWYEANDIQEANKALYEDGWGQSILRNLKWTGKFADNAAKIGGEFGVPLDIVSSAHDGLLLLTGDDSQVREDWALGNRSAAIALQTEGWVLFGGSIVATGAGVTAFLQAGAVALGAFVEPAGVVMAAVTVAALACQFIADRLTPEPSPLAPLLENLDDVIARQLPERPTGNDVDESSDKSATVLELERFSEKLGAVLRSLAKKP